MPKVEFSNCYGCGVCSIVCASHVIDIQINKDGFYEPTIINPLKCTNCDLCVNVCTYSDNKLSLKSSCIKSYAAWSKEPAVRYKCSSGGVGFEIGRMLIGKGYKVCGVKYNPDTNRAEHYIATTVEALIPSIGSKYIQSYTVDGFKSINRKEKYLVTGTPCQIDSFRRYIRKFRCEDNFVLMDFFCHGVPSMLLWDKYLKEVEKITGKATHVSWRNKFTGWHDSWVMSIDGEKTGKKVNWHDSYNMLIRKKSCYNSRLSQGDAFYNLFLSNSCLGKACYEKCKFKYDRSSADIRIGDLWGNTYKENEDGVSAVLALTERGQSLIKELHAYCVFEEQPASVVMEGQMKTSPAMPFIRKQVIQQLRKGKSLRQISNTTLRLYKISCLPKRIINKIIRILKWEKQ